MRGKKGFTLIELLVVIAIIALLLSIIMPALQKSKQSAQTILCQANLKQWGLAFKMYTDEHDDYFHHGWGGSAGASWWWMDVLRPYYDDVDKIRCCPYATKPEWNLDGTPGPGYYWGPQTAWGIDNGSFFNRGDYGSYGINGWILNPLEATTDSLNMDPTIYWRKMTVKGASQVPMMLDAKWIDMWPYDTDPPPSTPDESWGTYSGHFDRTCVDRHNEAQNFVFVDQSIRRIGLKGLWTLKWHRDFNTSGVWTAAGGATASDWPRWMENFKTY